MKENIAYPVYITQEKDKQKVQVPDLKMEIEFELGSMAFIMEQTRARIEVKLKELQDEGITIPLPDNAEYKKKKNEIFTYVDVNPYRFYISKMSDDELEDERRKEMWDVKDNVIEFLLNQKTMTLTLTQRKLINKVIALAEEWPEEVKLLHVNDDGSICAKMPTNYLKLNRPFRRELTEEEKEKNRENLAKGRELKKANQA